jgi:hypothetical protein
MPNTRDRLVRQFQAGQKRKITEDDPRWVQQLAHGQGQEHKVGANVTVPRRRRRYHPSTSSTRIWT